MEGISTRDASSTKDDPKRKNSDITTEIWRSSRFHDYFNSLSDAEREAVNFHRNFRGLLNKLSPSNFGVVVDKITTLLKRNPTRFSEAFDIIAHYAINDPLYRRWYIELVISTSSVSVEEGTKIFFSEKIETLFFIQENNLIKLAEKEAEMKANTDIKIKSELRVLLEEFRNKIKNESLGTCLVIGESYKLRMTSVDRFKFILECLLSRVDEVSLECTCKLLSLTGECLQYELDSASVDKYFDEIQAKYSDQLSSRIRFLLKDLFDLKENSWIPRSNNKHSLNEIDKIFNTVLRIKSSDRYYFLETIKSVEASDSMLYLAKERYLDKFKQERDLIEFLKNFKDIIFKGDLIYACLVCVLKREANALNCGRFLVILLTTKNIDFEIILDALLAVIKSYIEGTVIFNYEKWNDISTVFKILLLEKVIDLNSFSVLNNFRRIPRVKQYGRRKKKNNDTSVGARTTPAGSNWRKREKFDSSTGNTYQSDPNKKKEENTNQPDKNMLFNVRPNSGKVNSDLKKVTHDQFSTLVKKIQSANCAMELDTVISTILYEATEKPDLHPWYVQMCKTMDRSVLPCKESKSLKQFRLMLLCKCLSTVENVSSQSAVFPEDVASDSQENRQSSLEMDDQISNQKLFNKVRFICEVLKLRQTCENRIFIELFRNCIQSLLIFSRTDESIEYLCEFVKEFGEKLETSMAITTMYACLDDMARYVLEYSEYLATVDASHTLSVRHPKASELSEKIINMVRKTVASMKDFLKMRKPRIASSAVRSKCAEIFGEHVYLNDVKMYAVAFQDYFEPEQMSQVISGIIYEVIRFGRQPQAVEICGKLIAFMVKDEIITFLQLTNAVIEIISFDLPTLTRPVSLHYITEILGIIFNEHRTLFHEFDETIREKIHSNTDWAFLTVIKNKLDVESC